MAERPLRCPQCNRRTVRVALRSNNEDSYYCAWRRHHGNACAWAVYCDPSDTDDERELERLRLANPHRAEEL